MPDYSIPITHAVNNVWANPEQDKQLIYKTARVTPTYGTRHSFKVMQEKHTVPSQFKGSKFHVFQIAFIPESVVNLTLSYDWRRVSTLCNMRNMVIDIYLQAGLMLPRSECWIKTTNNGALILAVKQDRLIEFNTTDSIKDDVLMNHVPYIKFYTANYFSVDSSLGSPRDVNVYGKRIESSSDIVSFSENYQTYSAQVGKLYGYINGWFVDDIKPSDITVGDYVEFVYDSSIKIYNSVSMDNVPTFTSDVTNDDRHFLFHPNYQEEIHYFDDIDFYLVSESGSYSGKGLYINRNLKSNIKMMTHQGYSIAHEIIQSLTNSTLPELSNADSLKIVYVVRNSSFNRGLVSNKTRLNRFMALAINDTRVPQFKYENDLPLEEWKYRNIESAPINTLYGVKYSDLTPELIRDAYGYHTSARELAPPAHPVIVDDNDGTRSIDIPSLFVYGCTVYEYTPEGVLLGFYTHTGGTTYLPANIETGWVEIVSGMATDGSMVGDEGLFLNIDSNFEYRFYLDQGNGYVDVTDTPNYIVSDNVATWQNVGVDDKSLVLNDKYFFCQEFVFNQGDPVLVADVGYFTGDGNDRTFKSTNIPCAEVDVWVNGSSMAEGIDYFVVWPKVIVTNKNKVRDKNFTNTVIVRARGHAPSDLIYKPCDDSGFIKWGVFSRNDKYDIHWDQSLRCTINGRAVMPQNILYKTEGENLYYPYPGVFESEYTTIDQLRNVDGNGVITVLGYDQTHPLNGYPYSIRDSYTGLTAVLPGSTRDYRETMKDLDARMGSYLSEVLPEIEPPVNNTIVQKYPIVSPFMAACIDSIINEEIPQSVWDKFDYDEVEVRTATEHFSYLLQGDPTQDHIYNVLDLEIADLHAHPYYEKLPVNFNQYRFLEFVAHVILFDRVDISRFLTIGFIPPIEEPLDFLPLFYDEFDTGDILNRAVRTGQFFVIGGNNHPMIVDEVDGVNALTTIVPDPSENWSNKARWAIPEKLYQERKFTLDFYMYWEGPQDKESEILPWEFPLVKFSPWVGLTFHRVALDPVTPTSNSTLRGRNEHFTEVDDGKGTIWVYSLSGLNGSDTPSTKHVAFGSWVHVAIIVDGITATMAVDGDVVAYTDDYRGSYKESFATLGSGNGSDLYYNNPPSDDLFDAHEEDVAQRYVLVATGLNTYQGGDIGQFGVKHLRITRGSNQLYGDLKFHTDSKRPDIYERPVYNGWPSEARTETYFGLNNLPVIDMEDYYFAATFDGTKRLAGEPTQSNHVIEYNGATYHQYAIGPYVGYMPSHRLIGPDGDKKWAISGTGIGRASQVSKVVGTWMMTDDLIKRNYQDYMSSDTDFTMEFEYSLFSNWNGFSQAANISLGEHLRIGFFKPSGATTGTPPQIQLYSPDFIDSLWYYTRSPRIKGDGSWQVMTVTSSKDEVTVYLDGDVIIQAPRWWATTIEALHYSNRMYQRMAKYEYQKEPLIVSMDGNNNSGTEFGIHDIHIRRGVHPPNKERDMGFMRSMYNTAIRTHAGNESLNVFGTISQGEPWFYAISNSPTNPVSGNILLDSEAIGGAKLSLTAGASLRTGMSLTEPSVDNNVIIDITPSPIPLANCFDMGIELCVSLEAGITIPQPLVTPTPFAGTSTVEGGLVLLATSSSLIVGEVFRSEVLDGDYYKEVITLPVVFTENTAIMVTRNRSNYKVFIEGVLRYTFPIDPAMYNVSSANTFVILGGEGIYSLENLEALTNNVPGDPEYDAVSQYVGMGGVVEKFKYVYNAYLENTDFGYVRKPVAFDGDTYYVDPVNTNPTYAGETTQGVVFADAVSYLMTKGSSQSESAIGLNFTTQEVGSNEYRFYSNTGIIRTFRHGCAMIETDEFSPVNNSPVEYMGFSKGATATRKNYLYGRSLLDKTPENHIFSVIVGGVFRSYKNVTVLSLRNIEVRFTTSLTIELWINNQLSASIPTTFNSGETFNLVAYTEWVDSDLNILVSLNDSEIFYETINDYMSLDDLEDVTDIIIGASRSPSVASDPSDFLLINTAMYCDIAYKERDTSVVIEDPHHDDVILLINGGDTFGG